MHPATHSNPNDHLPAKVQNVVWQVSWLSRFPTIFPSRVDGTVIQIVRNLIPSMRRNRDYSCGAASDFPPQGGGLRNSLFILPSLTEPEAKAKHQTGLVKERLYEMNIGTPTTIVKTRTEDRPLCLPPAAPEGLVRKIPIETETRLRRPLPCYRA